MRNLKPFSFKRSFALLAVVGILLLSFGTAFAAPLMNYVFASPVFGLAAAPDGSLLVADAGAGVVELRKGQGSLVADLPGVADIAPLGRGEMYAVTGLGDGPNANKLFRVSRGRTQQIADLWAFEEAVNPAGGEVDSNPFDVVALNGGKAVVADAGGNDLLIVDRRGNVDWIATFPDQLASTDNIKNLANCPTPPPGFEFICGLPDAIPAQAVPTSVAIGPDGAFYVGELKGFPAPIGMSRVWRVEPDARHVDCGTSPKCSVVLDGFTSIVDLNLGPDGTLYVTELDEASWAAVEFGLGTQGGTVSGCDPSTWTCSVVAGGLPIPIATAMDKQGTLYAAILALVPGSAQVIPLP